MPIISTNQIDIYQAQLLKLLTNNEQLTEGTIFLILRKLFDDEKVLIINPCIFHYPEDMIIEKQNEFIPTWKNREWVIFPICQEGHFYLIILDRNNIYLYDSLHCYDIENAKIKENLSYLNIILKIRKLKNQENPLNLKFIEILKDNQANYKNNCGLYLTLAAKHIINGNFSDPPNMTEKFVNDLRKVYCNLLIKSEWNLLTQPYYSLEKNCTINLKGKMENICSLNEIRKVLLKTPNEKFKDLLRPSFVSVAKEKIELDDTWKRIEHLLKDDKYHSVFLKRIMNREKRFSLYIEENDKEILWAILKKISKLKSFKFKDKNLRRNLEYFLSLRKKKENRDKSRRKKKTYMKSRASDSSAKLVTLD